MIVADAAFRRNADDSGSIGKSGRAWANSFLKPERSAIVALPIKLLHPSVVEINDTRRRTVVRGQLHRAALAGWEILLELQDVANGRPPKTVETLVVVADDAEI